MQTDSKNIETLKKLGLTPLESKIYVALLKCGRAKVESIATVANVDRSNAYHAIKRLQNIGLIIKILNKPNFFEAISINDGLTVLLNRKEDDLDEMKNEAKKLISSMLFERPAQEPQFEIIKKPAELLIRDIIDICKNLENSIDLVLNTRTFVDTFLETFQYQRFLINRGVRYRLITENAITSLKLQKYSESLKKNNNFELRCVYKQPEVTFGIFDNHSVELSILPNLICKQSASLKTNHPGLIAVFQNYFDKLWHESIEYTQADKDGLTLSCPE